MAQYFEGLLGDGGKNTKLTYIFLLLKIINYYPRYILRMRNNILIWISIDSIFRRHSWRWGKNAKLIYIYIYIYFFFFLKKNQPTIFLHSFHFCIILRTFCICNESLETIFNFLKQVGAWGLGLEPALPICRHPLLENAFGEKI